MRPAVADRVAWSVCRSVTVVSPAKTTEPMPFELRTRLGPRNHILDGGHDSKGKDNFKGGRGGPL